MPCNLCGDDRPQRICDRGLFGETVHTRVCAGCGLVYQTPRPSPEEMARYYSDEYAKRYAGRGRVAEERHGESAARAHRREIARRRLAYLDATSDSGPGRALEIGCGEGEALLLLRERGWQGVGIEPSHDKAKRAGEDALDVRAALFEEVDLQARSFNLILHFHVLEHMPDPLSALRRMRGLLSDGGRMLLETPTLYRPRDKRLEEFLRKAHFFVFTPATLEPMLQLAGFRVVARDPAYSHLRWVCRPAGGPQAAAFDPGEARRARRWCRFWNLAFATRKWRRRLRLPVGARREADDPPTAASSR